ncbi:hypothetical protein BSNK01_21010 [Bacillaceae bacterium]
MKLPTTDFQERRLSRFCHDVASICYSAEFKKLHKEMSKLYRRSGVKDAKRVAFQDSLFALFLERKYFDDVEVGEIPRF